MATLAFETMPARSPRVSRSSAQPVVLTARGRRVVASLTLFSAVFLAYLLSGLFSAFVDAGTEIPATTKTVEYVVAPGETLWQLATELAPESDPRVLVDRIVTLNALPADQSLQAGQTIVLPVLN